MYGGSSFVIPKGAKNSAAAAEFIKWITTDPEGMKAWVSTGTSSMFPADPRLVPVTKSAFPTDYFGGQDIYAVGSESYRAIVPGWTWGPVMGTTNTALVDRLPKVADGGTKLVDALMRRPAGHRRGHGTSRDEGRPVGAFRTPNLRCTDARPTRRGLRSAHFPHFPAPLEKGPV